MRRTTCDQPTSRHAKRRRRAAAFLDGFRLPIARPRASLVREPGFELEVPHRCRRQAFVAELGREVLGDWDREVLGVLFLNARYRPLGYHFAFIGSAKRSVADPREVFRAALLMRARLLFLFHNHPSGDPTPGPDDISVTRRFIAAGSLVGIGVLDHIVVGDGGRWVSIRDVGLMPSFRKGRS